MKILFLATAPQNWPFGFVILRAEWGKDGSRFLIKPITHFYPTLMFIYKNAFFYH